MDLDHGTIGLRLLEPLRQDLPLPTTSCSAALETTGPKATNVKGAKLIELDIGHKEAETLGATPSRVLTPPNPISRSIFLASSPNFMLCSEILVIVAMVSSSLAPCDLHGQMTFSFLT